MSLTIISNTEKREKILNYISDLSIEVNNKIILKYFGHLRQQQIFTKSSEDDFVSIADRESEEFIVNKLQGFLDINYYVGEETSYLQKDNFEDILKKPLLWVIDPIDGTKNYINNTNEFCTMISLVSDTIPIATFIYYPLKELLVYAFKGFGSYLIRFNSQKTSRLFIKKQNIKNVLGSGGTKGIAEPLRQTVLKNLRNNTKRLFVGSAGIETIMLATNQIHFIFHGRVTPWDHSPLDLIIREAGGCVFMVNDKKNFNTFSEGPILAASNNQIWEEIKEIAFKKNDVN